MTARRSAPKADKPKVPAKKSKRGGAAAARGPHKPEVAGSTPAPATKKRGPAGKVPERPGSGATEGGSIPPARAPEKRAPRKSQQADQWSAAEREQLEAKGGQPLDLNRILTAEGAPDPDTVLHPRVKAFADEYLRDLNGTAAYLRIHPTASVRTAGTESWRLLKNPEVRAYVDAKRKRVALALDFTREDWLREQIAIVKADPSEITQMRCVACADCWPKEREPETPQEAKRKRDDEKGRLRFDDWLEPDPECQTCHGEGSPRVWFADTRKLSPEAKALFVSAYKTKDGMRIELRDQDAALERLGRALGVYEEDNRQRAGSASDVLRQFFAEMHGAARLPIAKPERQTPPADRPGGPLAPRL